MTAAACSAADQRPIDQHYPRPGWVEHDPEQLWAQRHRGGRGRAVGGRRLGGRPARDRHHQPARDHAAVGRGRAAVRWPTRSCGRTAARPMPARQLPADLIRERTGLVPDPYFSATKLAWLLEHAVDVARRPGIRHRRQLADLEADRRRGARHRSHQRLAHLLCSLRTLGLGRRAAGAVRRAAPTCCRRSARPAACSARPGCSGARLPVTGVAGDQQAALFGQACLEPGQAKVTYGTGSFLLVNDGERRDPPPHGLLRTAAAQPGGDGARGLGVRGRARPSSGCATGSGCWPTPATASGWPRSLDGNDGVYFVPALTGLGSPWWDADARGLIMRPHPRHQPRAPGAGGAGGDRLPGARRGGGDPGRGGRRCAPTAARPPTAG